MKPLLYYKKSQLLFTVMLFLVLIVVSYSLYHCLFPTLPSPGTPIRFYSSQVNADLRHTLRSAIESARKSVFISVYTLSDPMVLRALDKKSKEGVEVCIIGDRKTAWKCEAYLSKDIKTKWFITKTGIMHRKVLIIDDCMTFLGSANYTYESLVMHHNLIMGLWNPELAKALRLSLWKEIPIRMFSLDVGFQHIDIELLPRTSTLINAISKAQKSLQIAMFTWTNPEITQAVIDAYNRGIHVEAFLDHYSGRGMSKHCCKRLEDAGIPIILSQGKELLHHKCVIIDENILIHGSANWTKAAFTCNQEVLVTLAPLKPEDATFCQRIVKYLRCFTPNATIYIQAEGGLCASH